MLKSYLPAKFNTYAIVLMILAWIFHLPKILILLIFTYIFLYVILRKNRNDFRDDSISTRGIIFAPVNGKVIHIENNVSHGVYGEYFVEIQLMVSWCKEMGIFLPLNCEIKNLIVHKGRSIFRYLKVAEVIGTEEPKGIALSLDNRGDTIGLSFYKCKLGLWPEIIVMPGDKGGRRVNIGYFPFGGTVMLYLPKKYEILLKINDEIIAGETICAVIAENN
jgi:hypothetical protein